jgi:hypothetical protein
MKNIHVLPTDKPSNLLLCIKDYIEHKNTPAENFDKKGNFRLGFGKYTNTEFYQFKNIYITSDEEIKEGDWYYDTTVNVIFKNDKIFLNGFGYKKIILTTNQDLIADGVQAIDDEFLEWFVKDPSFEFVEVKRKKHFELDKSKRINPLNGFYYSCKIIIPKEEEPKQKTFEEVVKPLMKWLCENKHPHTTVIVTGNLAELVEGLESVKTDEFILD